MNKNYMPKSTEGFHNAITGTLNALPAKPPRRTTAIKTAVVMAAAVIMGIGAFAAGSLVASRSGWSSSKPDFAALPTEEQCIEAFDFAPKTVEEFSNGFKFSGGFIMHNELSDENGADAGSYDSLSCEYTKDNISVELLTYKADDGIAPDGELAETYNGTDIFYKSQKLILAPEGKITDEDREKLAGLNFDFSFGDCSPSAEDMAELLSGESTAVFSAVTEGEGIANQKTVAWSNGSVNYKIVLVSRENLSKEELLSMAKELIDR